MHGIRDTEPWKIEERASFPLATILPHCSAEDVLPAAMGSFHGVTRKAFHGPTYGREKCRDRIYVEAKSKDGPGFRCILL